MKCDLVEIFHSIIFEQFLNLLLPILAIETDGKSNFSKPGVSSSSTKHIDVMKTVHGKKKLLISFFLINHTNFFKEFVKCIMCFLSILKTA